MTDSKIFEAIDHRDADALDKELDAYCKINRYYGKKSIASMVAETILETEDTGLINVMMSHFAPKHLKRAITLLQYLVFLKNNYVDMFDCIKWRVCLRFVTLEEINNIEYVIREGYIALDDLLAYAINKSMFPFEAVKTLFSLESKFGKIDINKVHFNEDRTIFDLACHRGYIGVVKFLISHCDVKVTTYRWAVISYKLEILKLVCTIADTHLPFSAADHYTTGMFECILNRCESVTVLTENIELYDGSRYHFTESRLFALVDRLITLTDIESVYTKFREYSIITNYIAEYYPSYNILEPLIHVSANRFNEYYLGAFFKYYYQAIDENGKTLLENINEGIETELSSRCMIFIRRIYAYRRTIEFEYYMYICEMLIYKSPEPGFRLRVKTQIELILCMQEILFFDRTPITNPKFQWLYDKIYYSFSGKCANRSFKTIAKILDYELPKTKYSHLVKMTPRRWKGYFVNAIKFL